MRITLDIKEGKALAFLNFIQSLDFITIKDDELKLSSAQKKAIDEGLKEVREGKVLTQNEVAQELKKKHPKYFKE